VCPLHSSLFTLHSSLLSLLPHRPQETPGGPADVRPDRLRLSERSLLKLGSGLSPSQAAIAYSFICSRPARKSSLPRSTRPHNKSSDGRSEPYGYDAACRSSEST